jgi:hypothetical protein
MLLLCAVPLDLCLQHVRLQPARVIRVPSCPHMYVQRTRSYLKTARCHTKYPASRCAWADQRLRQKGGHTGAAVARTGAACLIQSEDGRVPHKAPSKHLRLGRSSGVVRLGHSSGLVAAELGGVAKGSASNSRQEASAPGLAACL